VIFKTGHWRRKQASTHPSKEHIANLEQIEYSVEDYPERFVNRL